MLVRLPVGGKVGKKQLARALRRQLTNIVLLSNIVYNILYDIKK
jgi:hypothetical protein